MMLALLDMTGLDLVAGISWEPEIRGALTAVTGVVVLMGSIWLILATNMGHRLATLVAGAGLAGWMLIMAVIWAFYGIGLRGDPPAWELVTIEGPASQISAAGDEADVRDLGAVERSGVSAAELVERYCPGLVAATEELRLDRVENPLLGLDDGYYSGPEYCTEEVGELLAVDADLIRISLVSANEGLVVGVTASPLGEDDPRYLQPDELEAAIETAIDDQTRKVSQLTLSKLAGAPDIIALAQQDGLIPATGDWDLLSEASAGEAIASADAFLVAVGEGEGGFAESSDFLVLNAYRSGGKPQKAADDNQLERAWNEVRNTVMFWQPDFYTVIQVQATIDKESIPGQPPQFAELDPDAEIVTVVMKRDPGGIIPGLSGLRTPAVLIAIASLVIFLVLCWMLNERDKSWARHQAEWDPKAAAS